MDKTPSRSFSKRLSRTVIALTGILFVLAAFLTLFVSYRFLEVSSTMAAELVLDNACQKINAKLSEVEVAVRQESWFFDRDLKDTARYSDAIISLIDNNPDLLGGAVAIHPDFLKKGRNPSLYIGVNDGQTYRLPLEKEGYAYTEMDWFTQPVSTGEAVWSEPYFDEGLADKAMVTYCYPLKDADGKVFAVLTADISLDWLSEVLASITTYEHGFMTVVSREGLYVAHPEEGVALKKHVGEYLAAQDGDMAVLVEQAFTSGERGMMHGRLGGRQMNLLYGPLGNGWSAAVICPFQDIFASLKYLVLFILVLSVVALFVMYRLVVRGIRRDTQPITDFTLAAEQIAGGRFDVDIPEVHTGDELQQLRDTLAFMQTSLNDYMAKLEQTSAANARFESELNIARAVQQSMLSTDFPVREEAGLCARLIPAKAVGGDLYDFGFSGDGERLYFTVGDVSGKGVPAALVMAICRATVRFVSGLGLSLPEILRRVSNVLCDGNDRGMFVTLLMGALHLKTGRVDLCNAGHNPMAVVSPDGKVTFYRAKVNLAAGLIDDFPYEGETLQLEKGSRLFVYTDGVVEAENARQEQYGEARLVDCLASLPAGASDQETIDAVLQSVKAFTGDNEQNDDITVLSLTYF